MRVHWKIQFLGGGGEWVTKKKYVERIGQFDLRRGHGEKEGAVFLRGVDTPMHTMYAAKKIIRWCYSNWYIWFSC